MSKRSLGEGNKASGALPELVERLLVSTGPGCWYSDQGAGSACLERRLLLPAPTRKGMWLAAMSLVVSRLYSTREPVVAFCNEEGGRAQGRESDIELFAGSVPDPTTVRALRAQAYEALARPAVLYTEAVAAEVGRRRGHDRLPLGLVFRAPQSFSTPPQAYRRFALTVTLSQGPAGSLVLRAWLRPQGGIDASMASDFLDCLVHTYRGIVGPGCRLAQSLPVVPEPQRRRIGRLGMGQALRPDASVRLEQRFEQEAARGPDRIALRDGRNSVTYRELSEMSTKMATGLVRLGLRPGDRVGLCLQRGRALVSAMLAALKAGCTYVPLDSGYPAERLRYICEDAKLALVITDMDGFPPCDSLRLVHPRALSESNEQERAALAPLQDGARGCPAYIIYTSGSSGRPKGVAIPHANVVSLIDATRVDFRFAPADVWTFFHSEAFDVSVWEIWGALLTGARLVIVPFWKSRDPHEFRALAKREGVTVLSQTPSAFYQLLQADLERPVLDRLRLVILAGEPLDARMLAPWFKRYPEDRCRVVNMYGITETTVQVTAFDVRRVDVVEGTRCVGRPIPGWHVYVFDEHGNPLPVGAVGEIYVGGSGVALGYVNRPRLTAERFVSDPFGPGLIYRSGDRGRLRADGSLEHLGRLDNQTKIRGFRVELDEIRHVLLAAPGVLAAEVLVTRADPTDPASARLDAFVVLRDGSLEQVRKEAVQRLPGYMLPATFTAVPEMPLTQNGKLDARSLRKRRGQDAADKRFPPHAGSPTDSLAQELAEVWAQVLGCAVNTSDNFFTLGGNSLYAARVIELLRGRGLPNVAVRKLYEHQTALQLAMALHAEGTDVPQVSA